MVSELAAVAFVTVVILVVRIGVCLVRIGVDFISELLVFVHVRHGFVVEAFDTLHFHADLKVFGTPEDSILVRHVVLFKVEDENGEETYLKVPELVQKGILWVP